MVNANPCARQEFIWRFYSCKKHHYHFVIAATEDEARSQLPDGPCIFTARFWGLRANGTKTYVNEIIRCLYLNLELSALLLKYPLAV